MFLEKKFRKIINEEIDKRLKELEKKEEDIEKKTRDMIDIEAIQSFSVQNVYDEILKGVN